MRFHLVRVFLLALLAPIACSGGQPSPPIGALPPTSSVPLLPDPAPPAGLRLPATVSPKRYSATLTMVPTASTFEGSIDVELVVSEAVSVLWLNATEITVDRAEITRAGQRLPLRVVAGGSDHVGFALPEPIPPGPATISVTYRGVISPKDDRGVFKENERGQDYVFSQFENIDARRAFPCFDEPSAKVPWQLTLEVRQGDTALSNTPVVSETPSKPGMKRVRFAETKPLPSYLVAFAVGPFDLVDAGRAGRNATPLRIAVPRGRGAEAATAATMTRTLLGLLEDYFDIPYPYEKLDVVTIPHLASFGAMENAGLITFFQKGLLATPSEDTWMHQRRLAIIMAHELSHHWFGDLVTMAWWDDVWLNEAFASWMELKMVARWKPEWSWETSRVADSAAAKSSDGLVSARKVRQEVVTKDDIQNAFDSITYMKGAALLDMFESWIGPERFQKGVKRYLETHAHKNASSRDFAAAISAEAGRDVGPVFASFLDQGGVPLVRTELSCAKGETSLRLSQSRFLPVGSRGSSQQLWQIPVCVRWDTAKGDGRACTLLGEPSAILPLPNAGGCPARLLPNAGSVGYYHVGYRAKDLDLLLRDGGKSLTLAERLGLVSDLRALLRGGAFPPGEALGRISVFAGDTSPHVRRAAAELLDGVPERTVPAALRPAFARFVNKVFGDEARLLGLQRKPGESEDRATLRPALASVAAGRGEDRTLIDAARGLALRWLDDKGAIDPDSTGTVLMIAARHGDRALFDRLRVELGKTTDEKQRARLFDALAGFRDPSIVRASLSLFLSGDLDPREALGLLFQDEMVAEVAFAFLKENFDAILEQMPSEARAMLPDVVSGLCDEARGAEVEAFFKSRIGQITGGPRALSQALEKIALCSALRKEQAESLGAFLKGY